MKYDAVILSVEIADPERFRSETLLQRVEELNGEIVRRLWGAVYPTSGIPSVIVRQIDLGFTVAFPGGLPHGGGKPEILALIYRLQAWSRGITEGQAEGGGVRLRIGVHFGRVDLVRGIGGNIDFCGTAGRVCREMMDAADGGQVLFSEEARREFYHWASAGGEEVPGVVGYELRLTDPYWVMLPSLRFGNVSLLVPVPLGGRSIPDGWNTAPPRSRDRQWLNVTESADELDEGLHERLSASRQIALVMEYGYPVDRLTSNRTRLISSLASGLRRLWLFIPDVTVENSVDNDGLTSDLRKRELEEWRAFRLAVHEEAPHDADVALKSYKGRKVPLTMACDWSCSGGLIRVAHSGRNQSSLGRLRCDLEWIDNQPTRLYAHYHRVLDDLNEASTSVNF